MRGSVCLHPTLHQQERSVGNAGRLREVVSDEGNRQISFCEVADEGFDARRSVLVEGRGRLVHQQDLGSSNESTSNAYALPLSDRQRHRVPVEEGSVKSDGIERLDQGTVINEVETVGEIGADGSVEEDRGLEDHPDPLAQRGGIKGSDVRAVEQDLSGMGFLEPVQAAKETRLAGTRRTHDGGNQAGLETRIHIAEHPAMSAPQADASGLEWKGLLSRVEHA
jgi:hypothetical protein